MPESLFNKVAGRPATLLKKRLWQRCFPANFVKFLRTTFLQNTSGRPLLVVKTDFSKPLSGDTIFNNVDPKLIPQTFWGHYTKNEVFH